MRGPPRRITAAMRGCCVGTKRAETAATAATWRDATRIRVVAEEDCGKLRRGQIGINSRVTKPRLKY